MQSERERLQARHFRWAGLDRHDASRLAMTASGFAWFKEAGHRFPIGQRRRRPALLLPGFAVGDRRRDRSGRIVALGNDPNAEDHAGEGAHIIFDRGRDRVIRG